MYLYLPTMPDTYLPGYHVLPAVKADLLRRLGHDGPARAAYEEAHALAVSQPERDYLARRIAELGRPQESMTDP